MKPTSTPALLAGFAIALALLAGSAWLDSRYEARAQETTNLVSQTEQVRDAVDHLLIRIQKIEIAAHGYVIAGDPALLEPFEASLHHLDEQLDAVRKLTRDNPKLQAHCDALEPLIAQHIALAQTTVNARKNLGFEAARAEIINWKNKAMTHQIRTVVARMDTDEQLLLDHRALAAKHERSNAGLFSIAGKGLSFALLTAVFALVLRENNLRRTVEQVALETSHQLQNVLAAATEVSIIGTDTEGVIQIFNAGAERMFGYTAGEMIGRVTPAVVHLEKELQQYAEELSHEFGQPVTIFDALTERASQGHPEIREWTCIRKDGSQIIVKLVVTAIHDDEGATTGFLCVGQNVTRRKQAEEQRDRFFKISLDLLCIASLDGCFKQINPAFGTMFGYNAEELLARPFLDFIHPDDRDSALVEMSRLRNGEPTIQFENRFQCKDGSWKYLSWVAQPFPEEGLIYAAGRDVTGRKRAEALLHKTHEELEQRVKERTAELERANQVLHESQRQQQQLADTLELERNKLAAAFENTGMGLVLSDGQGGDISMNAAALKFHGFTSETDGKHEESADEWPLSKFAIWGGMHEKVEEYVDEWELRYPDGRIMPFDEWPLSRAVHGDFVRDYEAHLHNIKSGYEWVCSYTTVPVKNSEGKVTLIVMTLLDITERKKSQAQLEEAFSLLLSTLESTDDGILVVDLTGKIRSFNQRFKEMWHIPDGVLQTGDDQKALELVMEQLSHPEEFISRVRTIYSQPDMIGNDLIEFKDGRIFQRHTQPQKLGAAITGRVWSFYDVTAHMQAKEEIRALNASLEQRVERRTAELVAANRTLADFKAALDEHSNVTITDTLGSITYANDKFCAISKYSRAELLGQDHRIVNSGYHPKSFFSKMWETITSGRVWKGEMRNRGKDGSLHWLSTTIVPFLDSDGKPVQYIAIRTDITQRKESEKKVELLNARLQQHTDQLLEANKELESFSYSVSHDLRSPLRAIDGFSQVLEEDYSDKFDDVGRSYLARVRSAAGRMGELIDDLLKLSRITRTEMERRPVDLSVLARTVAEALQQRDPDRQVQWEITEGLTGECDPHLLRAALENLFGNAWKFTGKQAVPRIEFGQIKHEGQAAFYVRDNGAGFDMTHSKKLFGAFQRLHTTAEFEGTGIGLATVQRIMHRHGGRIWAEAEVDKGATFYFTL